MELSGDPPRQNYQRCAARCEGPHQNYARGLAGKIPEEDERRETRNKRKITKQTKKVRIFVCFVIFRLFRVSLLYFLLTISFINPITRLSRLEGLASCDGLAGGLGPPHSRMICWSSSSCRRRSCLTRFPSATS